MVHIEENNNSIEQTYDTPMMTDQTVESRTPLYGFKIVGDNIDKNIRARYASVFFSNEILCNMLYLGYHYMSVWVAIMLYFRFVRDGHNVTSLHCYNSYAVRDRIDISNLSNEMPDLSSTPLLSIPVASILPSTTDTSTLLHNFTILISRELVNHMKFFRDNYSDVVTRHITHDYYKEMSQRSETVRIYTHINA